MGRRFPKLRFLTLQIALARDPEHGTGFEAEAKVGGGLGSVYRRFANLRERHNFENNRMQI